MKDALLVLALAVAVWAARAEKPRLRRASVAAVEKSFDSRFARSSAPDSFDLLGTTRGIYLEGYGVVFTTELNLVLSPILNPFRQPMTKEEAASVHNRKLKRLPLLKETMRQMLINAAASLDNVAVNEKVVFGVTLTYYSWEDRTGLPSQVVMQAERQKLLDFQASRIDTPALDNAIRTTEF